MPHHVSLFLLAYLVDPQSLATMPLCHGCFGDASSLPFSCARGYCRGSAVYCSEQCRDDDLDATYGGQHTHRRCRFLGLQRRCLGGVQIVAGRDETFPVYKLCPSSSEACLYEPSGDEVECIAGDTGRIVRYPDEIDACGSLLVHIDKRDVFILCDVDALAAQTSEQVDRTNQSDAIQAEATFQWMRGVRCWYNEQDYRQAMAHFEESLEAIVWEEEGCGCSTEEKFGGDEEENIFYREMLRPPPLRTNEKQYRLQIARRAYFFGACLLDADQTEKGRRWLMKSLRSIPTWEDCPFVLAESSGSKNGVLCQTQNVAAMELALSYEEAGEVGMARHVAQWSIESGIGCWTDAYQRPGYLYMGEDNSTQPFISADDPKYPSWCRALEQGSDTILQEFLPLVGGARSSCSSDIQQPQHWPMVGSGDHRGGGGASDHRVVGEGGDWREHVLFGSGASHNDAIAPKTKDLIRKHAKNAVDLAESGAGEIIFSVLAPGTKIAPHCSSTNIRLTAHLGLVVPEEGNQLDEHGIPKCGIRVADEWHGWKVGRMLVFDDSFEHEVRNDTDQVRAVLLLRFYSPSISHEKREPIVSECRRMKSMETTRRYNPPLPNRYEEFERIGLGLSQCPRCFSSGHDSILLSDLSHTEATIVCEKCMSCRKHSKDPKHSLAT